MSEASFGTQPADCLLLVRRPMVPPALGMLAHSGHCQLSRGARASEAPSCGLLVANRLSWPEAAYKEGPLLRS